MALCDILIEMARMASRLVNQTRRDVVLPVLICALSVVGSACTSSPAGARGVINDADSKVIVRVASAGATSQFGIPPHARAALPQVSPGSGEVLLVAIFLEDCTVVDRTYFAATEGQIGNSWLNGGTWHINAGGQVELTSEKPVGWTVAQSDPACADASLPPAPSEPHVIDTGSPRPSSP